MEAKHTPGPWAVIDLEHGIVVRTESPRKTRFGASRYAAIGGFERSDPEQHAEALANARLIAAAPDLLFQLLAASNYIDALGGDSKSYRAAIAAATGSAA